MESQQLHVAITQLVFITKCSPMWQMNGITMYFFIFRIVWGKVLSKGVVPNEVLKKQKNNKNHQKTKKSKAKKKVQKHLQKHFLVKS